MTVLNLARRHAVATARHRWIALLVAWLVCGAGWFAVQLLPSQYQSSARVYADADAILSLLLRGIAVDSSPAGQVEVLQRTLLSRPNLQRIIDRTALQQRVSTQQERDDLVEELSRAIRITTQTRNLFTIDYRDRNPVVARDVVQATVTLFLEAATNTDRQQMDSARVFVQQQIGIYEGQLRQAEARRAEFQARYLDILPSDSLGGASRLESARARLQQVRGELQDARMLREITQQQIDATPTTLAGAAGSSRLADAERTLAELRLRLTDRHPQVVAARGVVEELRRTGGGATTGGGAARTNPVLEQLRVRMVDVEGQIASLERQAREREAEVERLDAIARSAPEVRAQSLNLSRDYDILRRNLEELLTRREALQIAGAARTSSDRVRLEVVDPPLLPHEPVFPNRPLFFAGVLVAGIGAGLGVAFLLSQLDRSFYTVHDLRRLGLPVLGGVSAPPMPRRMAGTVLFTACFLLLLAGFGAVLAGVPGQILRQFA